MSVASTEATKDPCWSSHLYIPVPHLITLPIHNIIFAQENFKQSLNQWECRIIYIWPTDGSLCHNTTGLGWDIDNKFYQLSIKLLSTKNIPIKDVKTLIDESHATQDFVRSYKLDTWLPQSSHIKLGYFHRRLYPMKAGNKFHNGLDRQSPFGP